MRTHVYKCNGSQYRGEWIGGFRDGHGIMKWSDGATFEGEWKDNHCVGKGKFLHTVGDVYEGDWKRD